VKKNVGALVRQIRGELTQNEFARRLNVNQSIISEIEANKKEPGKKLAKRLAEYSGKPMEDFIN
jgi:transcriptional regulator with XRE-family HTH domain